MKIAMLSRAPSCYSSRRIREAAISRGHEIGVLDTARFSLLLEQGRPSLSFKGRRLERYHAVIPRIGASITFFGTAVVRQFQHMGVFCLNGAEAIVDTRDKLRTMQLLSRHDIGIPPTAVVRNNKQILPAIESVGGAPVVIKLIQGTQGVGVILAETIKTAESVIETLRTARQNVLIQKFVSESRGRDIRAFVVGDRVVAAIRRVANAEHEFRSNLHRGGKPEPVKLDPIYEQTAIRAMRIVGLHVAGVDLLEGKDGPQVAEINNSPGLQGIEAATGIDVAGSMIEYLERCVGRANRNGLPLSDVRRIAELIVPEGSDLIGQTVFDTHVPGREFLVLRVQRPGVESEANHCTGNGEQAASDHAIRSGDRLLCFGRIQELRSIAPEQVDLEARTIQERGFGRHE